MSPPHKPKKGDPEWKRLCDLLDVIYRQTEDAIDYAYHVRRNKALDESLAVIIQTAEEARRILRL